MRSLFPRIVAGLAALIVLAAAGYFFWRQWPGHIEDGCNLHERLCSAPLTGGGRVILGFEPRPLGYNRPLQVSVVIEGARAEHVSLDLAGLDVPTSFNRIALAADKKPGHFKGEVWLPMCLSGPIDWQATVAVDAGGSVSLASFPFNSDPGNRVPRAIRQALAPEPTGGASILRGADGRPFLPEDLRGKVSVLFFGTSAAGPGCPQPFAVIDAALAGLSPAERERVQVVMVALDATQDAPERLEPELRSRHAANYRVVTGAGADLIGTARLYGAVFVPRGPGADGRMRIDHAAINYLIDPSGRFVGQVADQRPDRLLAALRRVLAAPVAVAPAPTFPASRKP